MPTVTGETHSRSSTHASDRPDSIAEPPFARFAPDAQGPVFQAALPGRRSAAYLCQRGIPLALAQQLRVGYAAPGTWPHAARDWRGGRCFPQAVPDGVAHQPVWVVWSAHVPSGVPAMRTIALPGHERRNSAPRKTRSRQCRTMRVMRGRL